MEEVKEIITSFRKKRDWSKYDSESNLAKSIIIEAAELLKEKLKDVAKRYPEVK